MLKYEMFNTKWIRILFVLTTSFLMSLVKVLNGMQTGVLKSNVHNTLSTSCSTVVRHSCLAPFIIFSVFGTSDEILALVVDILLLTFDKRLLCI